MMLPKSTKYQFSCLSDASIRAQRCQKIKKSPLGSLRRSPDPPSQLATGAPPPHTPPIDSIDVSTLLGAFCPGIPETKSAPMNTKLCRKYCVKSIVVDLYRISYGVRSV